MSQRAEIGCPSISGYIEVEFESRLGLVKGMAAWRRSAPGKGGKTDITANMYESRGQHIHPRELFLSVSVVSLCLPRASKWMDQHVESNRREFSAAIFSLCLPNTDGVVFLTLRLSPRLAPRLEYTAEAMVASTISARGAFFTLTMMNVFLVYGQSGEAAKTIIPNSDPAISYLPEYCPSGGLLGCYGAWWDTTMNDGSIIKTTAGPTSHYNNAQTAFSYSFYGSNIELHGLGDTFGANIIMQLDSFLVIVNTSTGSGGPSQLPQLLYNSSDLDPQTIHTLSVGWSRNNIPNKDLGVDNPLSFAYFDRLEISNYRPADGIASAASSTTYGSTVPASPTAASLSSQSASPKLKSGALAGVIIASLLCFILFCAFSAYFLRYRRRRRTLRHRPTSSHVKVTIESDEIRFADIIPSPSPSESWKAHPHLSLPPAYVHSGSCGVDAAGYGCEKGVSYLDLEPGSTSLDSVPLPFLKFDPVDGEKKKKSRLSVLSSLSSSTPSNVSHPPRAKLRVNTRKSERAPRTSALASVEIAQAQTEQGPSPVTPFTPYCVATATVVRPQNAQRISNAGLNDKRMPKRNIPLDAPLPPLPAVPSPRKEKRRDTKVRSTLKSSRAGSSGLDKDVSDMLASTGNAATRSERSNALDLDLDVGMVTPRPSFDAMSVMTRSVPPPYALHA
ncbi:uncharacterized protein FOMMEDRAFT_149837 [Fomitiporia mediterranea MF3/22]|uniref:uncharacterized protein n=1 Tax=Fomitiporia mediterranea (strain MF3/22) TaxID=694068 RepID=UPI00044078FB|nr:uncharacterized protein FOMMEDRAFT_149837 [Fomitiporia mediterranea MF3/22]EJD07320.1 hypothetical protein FOMMEDRAFT_149837 [Fomitiporia mediterranea MF3/22]